MILFLVCTFSAFINGQIRIKLVLPDNCYVDFTKQLIIQSGGEALTMSISPNPSTGTFTLKLSNSNVLEKIIISIYDTKGNIIFKEIVFSDSNNIVKKICLNDLSNGIYVLEAKSNDQTSYSKIVINKNLVI